VDYIPYSLSLVFTLTQDFEKKKAESRTPHFLILNQDIVASPQDEKCEVCNPHFKWGSWNLRQPLLH
jgi:hypothetical protein